MLNNIAITETALFPILFALVLVWTLIWEGIALWKAARAGSKKWFIALLLINTLGILEILYIFVFSKKEKEKEKSSVCCPHEKENLS